MKVTSRKLKCSVCGRRSSFAKDKSLEKTGVCAVCAQREKEKR